MNKTVTFNDLYPFIKEQLEEGGSVAFTIHGTSMMPMLAHGIDSVRIHKPEGRLKKYDIPFYRRKDGSFVLHRIVKVTKDGYICRGDNQLVNEYGVTDDMIIGVTDAYTNGGRWIDIKSREHKKYAFRRVNGYYIRKPVKMFYVYIKRLFGKGKQSQ